jgi:hypothetical protein
MPTNNRGQSDIVTHHTNINKSFITCIINLITALLVVVKEAQGSEKKIWWCFVNFSLERIRSLSRWGNFFESFHQKHQHQSNESQGADLTKKKNVV